MKKSKGKLPDRLTDAVSVTPQVSPAVRFLLKNAFKTLGIPCSGIDRVDFSGSIISGSGRNGDRVFDFEFDRDKNKVKIS
jgi:hypothetical protein